MTTLPVRPVSPRDSLPDGNDEDPTEIMVSYVPLRPLYNKGQIIDASACILERFLRPAGATRVPTYHRDAVKRARHAGGQIRNPQSAIRNWVAAEGQSPEAALSLCRLSVIHTKELENRWRRS